MAAASSVISVQKIEDIILIVTPYLTLPVLLALGFPMTAALLVGVALSGLGKGLAGITQNPKSWEDWLLLAGSVIGSLSATLSTTNGLSPVYGEVAIVLGFLAKGIIGLVQSYQQDSLEDGMLVLGSLIGAIGAFIPSAKLVQIGLLLASFSKAVPGIVSGIAGQTPPATTTSASPAGT